MSALEDDETAPIRSAHRRAGPPRRARWPLALVLVWAAAAVLDLVFFHIGTGSGHPAAAKDHGPKVAAHRPVLPRTAPPQPTPTSKPAPAPVVLTPVSAKAFGPTGYGSGDNATAASLAIDHSAATAWKTSWYRSAHFGNLQDGTGLLLDLGRAMRITSVQVLLQHARGADVQLYTGNEPVRADMLVSATADDVGGELPLSLATPRKARYLLIWFTLLPADSSGTFQASIYNVAVDGAR